VPLARRPRKALCGSFNGLHNAVRSRPADHQPLHATRSNGLIGAGLLMRQSSGHAASATKRPIGVENLEHFSRQGKDGSSEFGVILRL